MQNQLLFDTQMKTALLWLAFMKQVFELQIDTGIYIY